MIVRNDKKSTGHLKTRIISGIFYPHNIIFSSEVKDVRPTLHRIRETVFSWFTPFIANSKCIDVFSGSGILGFESLSRRASHVTFIEHDKTVIKFIRYNIKKFNVENHVNLIKGNALDYLNKKFMKKFNIIFLDPPFHSNLMETSLSLITNNINISEKCLIYIEHEKKTPPVNINQFDIIKSSKTRNIFFGIICKKSVPLK